MTEGVMMSSASRTLRRINEHAAKEVRSAICKVLWELWDPMGVNHDAKAFGGYDTYADGVCALLTRGASDSEIVHHLRHMETVNMGRPASSKEHLASVVSASRAVDREPPGAA